MVPRPPWSPLFPYTTLFRSGRGRHPPRAGRAGRTQVLARRGRSVAGRREVAGDRKSTRLNSSHMSISYAVFCLKKKTVTWVAGGTFQTAEGDVVQILAGSPR